MPCIICGKPTRPGANVCSITCAQKPQPPSEETQGQKRKKLPASILQITQALQKAQMTSSPKATATTSTLKLQHRWMKNRSLLSGRTVFAFDAGGVASIPVLGSVYEDLAGLQTKYPGLITVLEDPRAALQEAPEVKVETDVLTEDLMAAAKASVAAQDALREPELVTEAPLPQPAPELAQKPQEVLPEPPPAQVEKTPVVLMAPAKKPLKKTPKKVNK